MTDANVSPIRRTGTAATGNSELDTVEQLQHVALPRLYGAPAYGRPRVAAVAETARPFDPDDLPIAAEMTDEDREILALAAAEPVEAADEPLAPRAFSIRRFADRLRHPRS